MKLGRLCTTCERRIEPEEIVRCETCGRDVHEPCDDYRTSFECRYCGEETAIGALEF